MALPGGTRLGPYEIIAPAGAGGMGDVYKARDTRLDRTAAIKVLPDHAVADQIARERLEREAKAISALTHPHICTLDDIGAQDAIDFLVMEYVEAETLAARLEKGALPIHQALTYAVQIASALDRAPRGPRASRHQTRQCHVDPSPPAIHVVLTWRAILDAPSRR